MMLPPGMWWPSSKTWMPACATIWVESPDLRTTLASTVRPCMSIPSAPPRISSIWSTSAALMRESWPETLSLFEAGRRPSIRMLPAAPEYPRTDSPSSAEKPGRRFTMSMAVEGRYCAKKAGS